MCGVAGYIERRETPSNPIIIENMLSAVKRRGPDGEGSASIESNHWRTVIGHRRLSIIDLSLGAQPMNDRTNKYSITFNGEIFNYPELRQTLVNSGSQFLTHSDTEVILELWKKEGENSLEKLNGMFAFGLWDAENNEFHLARDRAGIKPLFYYHGPNGVLIFASELTSLLSHPLVPKQIAPLALANYFTRDFVSSPDCIVRGIRKLEPGTHLKWRDGKIEIKKYWNLDEINTKEISSFNQVVQLAESTLISAVKRQMIADVPVGVLLSGGIDSSLVSLFAQRSTSQRLKSFSISFEDKSFDERLYAKEVANLIGTDHFDAKLTEHEAIRILDEAIDLLDEPISDPSFLPTFFLSRLAANHLKVVLSGDGADELWGGYPTYRAAIGVQPLSWLSPSIFQTLGWSLDKTIKTKSSYQSLEWKLKKILLGWEKNPVTRHQRWMSSIDDNNLEKLVGVRFGNQQIERERNKDLINTLMRTDFKGYMTGSVLTKVDRASMLNGLEVRPPFLDNEMIQLAFEVPSKYKVNLLKTKKPLREIAKKYFPKSIFERPKHGFAIPLSKWINGSLKARLVERIHSSRITNDGLIQKVHLVKMLNEHQSGSKDFSKSLWAFYVMARWYEKNKITH